MKKEIKAYKSKKLNGANFNDFTHNEYRVYLNLIGKIVKVDSEGNYLTPNKLKRDYLLTAKEFNNIFDCNMKHAYEIIKRACKTLMHTYITLNRIDLDEVWDINVCSSAKYNSKEGYITIKFTDDIMPYLAQASEKFILYDIKEVACFKSLHTTRLYEQIQEFKDTGYFIKSIVQVRSIFMVGKKYKNYNDLKKKTFGHAVQEINKNYHIDLDFQEIKEGRKVVAIKFTFNKTKIARRYKQDGTYTNEYIKPKAKTKYPDTVLEGQLSFEDKQKNQGQIVNAVNNILQNLQGN